MDAKADLKARLPSRHVTEGPERAPRRSYDAMGQRIELIHQPFAATPCKIALMRQARAVKHGVACAGGPPREFCTITVTDGIAMGHQATKSSLRWREAIADSVELTMQGHAYDVLVGLAGCDKSLPGMMMAMCRLNVPAIFIYGGSILPGTLPGTFKRRAVTVQDVFEAVGRHSVGAMSESDLEGLEQIACPSTGACRAQFTANTRATVSEAMDLALPYSAGAPAPYEIRDRFCMTAGGIGPDAATQRPIGLLRHGEVIEFDAVMGFLTERLSDEELANRKREWKPRSNEFTSGYLWKYAHEVGPARNGAVTHPGGGAETSCYADI